MPETLSRSRLFWWLGAGALVLGVFVLASWQASRPRPDTRYVSPPLPDGTRYTFLYPTGLGVVRTFTVPRRLPSGKTSSLQYAWVVKPFGPMERLLYRSPFLVRVFHANDYESVTVMRSDNPATPFRSSSRPPVVSPDGHSSRSEDTLTSPDGADHRILVTDRRSGMRYSFSHRYTGIGLRRRFERDDAAIAHSFQILAPGTAPPMP